MKITLDHNCIINLHNQCFVVNIGASEMLEKGVRPDLYEKFEELLESAGIAHLPRLNPAFIFDVTFWDRCIWVEEESIKAITNIQDILFSGSQVIDLTSEAIGSATWRKWLNRQCDIQGMWCHLQNKNEVFLTADTNFTKKTKLPKLLALGAGRICHPRQL
jgi:hypothetical protein